MKALRISMIALLGILMVSPLAACVLFGALNLQAQQRRVFRGEITAGNSSGRYLLSNSENKMPYRLDDQANAAAFLGKPVLVVGALDETTDTILVSNIVAVLPPKVMKAVLVNVDCYDCPREMAAAKKAGLLAIGNWKRFYLAPDPRRADLVFLLSAAPYPGDYLTRDRPPARSVPLKVTYLNVIDPRTGRKPLGRLQALGQLVCWRGHLKLDRPVSSTGGRPGGPGRKLAGLRRRPAPESTLKPG